MKELTDHEMMLKKVYAAIATLRKNRTKVTISAVAKESGIARGTLYYDHPDWKEVCEIIKRNKPSTRIILAEVELTETQKWESQLGQLHKKVNELSLSVVDARNLVDDVYAKLLAEVHKYFILAKETPQQFAKKAEIAQESANLQIRLDSALAEVRQLKSEKGLEGKLFGFPKKEVINIYQAERRSSLRVQDLNSCCYDAINALDRYFKDPEFAPTLVYVMCGQFASGKSRWIRNHQPKIHGTALYIDGTNHTTDLRALFVTRLRGLNKDCRIVCCRVFAALDECLERNRDATRKRTNMTIPEALLHHIQDTFVEVSYYEGFDAIELAGGR